MKDQEIRDAVENIIQLAEQCHPVGLKSREYLDTLLALAQEYLSIKGMPEEKPREIDSIQSEDFLPYEYHNRCLKQCKLALMKMMSREKLFPILTNMLSDIEIRKCEEDKDYKLCYCNISDIVTKAINLIGGKE